MADISAAGPIYAAGFVPFSDSGWEILFLPDIHNDELQRAGKPPVYHWLPNTVRLAQRENGDYKFSFIHFEGVRGHDTHVGVSDPDNEVTGGLLSFSTTASPPTKVLDNVQEQLLNAFRGKDDKYWGWRTSIAPQFRPAPIVSNKTVITNLSPNSDGSLPTAPPAGGAGGPGANGGGPGGNGGGPGATGGGPRGIGTSRAPLIRPARMPRSVPLRQGFRDSNLDQWYCNLQGQGDGSVTPFAENAYGGLVGSLPAALIWSSFHTGTGGISVWQKMKMRVWSPAVHIRIHGDWDRIQVHLSAAAHFGAWFYEADLQAQFNYMRQSGMIQVIVEVDSSLPNADKLQESVEKRSDLVFQKFMEAAQKVIFEPAPFEEKPAQASGGFLGFGGGVALKLRVDMTHLTLDYDETRQMAYLQDYPISGQLEGLYDVIRNDPEKEKKYFTTLYLSDWERMVTRVVKPIVNWPNPAQQWIGQPVAFLSAQVGYPNTHGEIQWDGHMFQSSEGPGAGWNSRTEMKAASEVSNAPAGWTPDKTFIKRQIHFIESAGPLSDLYSQVQVEKEVVDLDPGENGTLTSDINLEVRVDDAGTLGVGPITLDVDLDAPNQVVEVTFQALGKRLDGGDHEPVKFSWNQTDQAKPRYWMLFTGNRDFQARYKYQVRVVVKGGLFSHGKEWSSPWIETVASGPIMVSVPPSDDPTNVNVRQAPLFVSRSMERAARAAQRSAAPQPVAAQAREGARRELLSAREYRGARPPHTGSETQSTREESRGWRMATPAEAREADEVMEGEGEKVTFGGFERGSREG